MLIAHRRAVVINGEVGDEPCVGVVLISGRDFVHDGQVEDVPLGGRPYPLQHTNAHTLVCLVYDT